MTTFRRFGSGIHPAKLNLLKNVVAIFCLLLTIAICRAPFPDDISTALYLAASGLIGLAIGDTFLFAALQRLGAQMTSASQCLSPIFAALLAWMVLGEELNALEISGMIVTSLAVAGAVAFQIRIPNSAEFKKSMQTGLVFAVISALANAIGIVIARQSFGNVHVATGTALRILPAIAVLPFFYLARRDKAPVLKSSIKAHWLPLTLAAFGGTFLGVMLLSYGTKYAKAGIAASLSITYPLWIIPIAHFILKEPVRPSATICTCIAIAGVLLMMLGA